MTIAVYPGSFDPFTNGHLDILERSLKIFETVIVGVLVNPSKNCSFSVEKRMEIISQVLKKYPEVRIDHFSGLLVDYCRKVNARAIIRGLRAVSDYEYELQMASINKQLYPEVETMFMMASTQYSFLTSSIVKEVARHGGDISSLASKVVQKELKQLFSKPKK
jgi:pantetheine-phosphate adenylyltransferase